MTRKNDGLTRRAFVKGIGLATVGGAVGISAGPAEGRKVRDPSRVVLIRNEDVVKDDGTLDGGLVKEMLNEALMALLGPDNPDDCWKQIIRPDDIVGIKTNIWRFLPTPAEVEDAIKDGIRVAGVPEQNVGIGDQNVLQLDIFQRTTALINTRPMRTHAWSGVGSLIKNYIMFDNPSDYHPDACADLAKLWELPTVKGKTRLNVLVMLTPQFHNMGPHHFDPIYTWPYGGLIVSTDPVAADAVGLMIIQAKRRQEFGEDRPLQPTAHHIRLADTVHGLGNADRSAMDLVLLGSEKDLLI